MEVSYLGVVLAAVVSMVVGAFWYSPAGFGKQWMKLSGMKASDIEKAKKAGMGKLYAVALVASIVMAWVLAGLMDHLGVADAMGAIRLAVMVWLGFIATVLLGRVLWHNDPVNLWILNIAYYLVSLALMALVLVYV